jgi:hypothetical protein
MKFPGMGLKASLAGINRFPQMIHLSLKREFPFFFAVKKRNSLSFLASNYLSYCDSGDNRFFKASAMPLPLITFLSSV